MTAVAGVTETVRFQLALAVLLRDGFTRRAEILGPVGFRFDGAPRRAFRKLDGYFAFTGLPAGQLAMTADAPLYFPLREAVTVPAVATVETALVLFSLSPRPDYPYPAGTTLLRGRVTDARGTPLSGVAVAGRYPAAPRRGEKTPREESAATWTDDRPRYEGRYALALPGLAPGAATVDLSYSLAGWQTLAAEAPVARGRTSALDVTMQPEP